MEQKLFTLPGKPSSLQLVMRFVLVDLLFSVKYVVSSLSNLCFCSSSPAAFEWFTFNSSLATHLHVMVISGISWNLELGGIKHILSNFLRKKKKLTGIDGSCHWLSGRVVITFPSSCLIENISSWSVCCISDVSPKTFYYIVHCFDVISICKELQCHRCKANMIA